MKTKSALSWFGSDASVAQELASLLNDCKHVTIPFVGGASIIPHLKARAIVANDLNSLAINFYKVASGIHGDRDWLLKQCEQTLSHPAEVREASAMLDSPKLWSSTDLAWAFWAQTWLSRKGTGGTDRVHKSTTSVRWSANGGNNASRLRSVVGDMDEWCRHLARCEWQCLDFRDIASKLKDQADCGSYWDPPWPTAGDRYVHKFTEQDHHDMAEAVHRFREHRVVIRYGDDPLIRDLYSGDQWTITEIRSRNQANNDVSEIWIANFKSASDIASPGGKQDG